MKLALKFYGNFSARPNSSNKVTTERVFRAVFAGKPACV
jgi:hypothetical protein